MGGAPYAPDGDLTSMRSALDDVLNLLGSNNRDYLILALAVLVLVEGAIIVLWARRAVRLRRELEATVAAAEAARVAWEAAARAVAADPTPTYKVGERRQAREVFSVARGGAVETEDPAPAEIAAGAPPVAAEPEPPAPAWQPPAPPAVVPSPTTAALGAPSETGETPDPPSWPPALATNGDTPPTVPTWRLRPPAGAATSAAAAPPGAEPDPAAAPPAEYVDRRAEQAAAWVLPEVEASHAAAPEPPAPTEHNGWFPAAAAAAAQAPTAMGWSGTPVPVEPAADFAVIKDAAEVEPAPVRPRAIPTAAPEPVDTPSLTVLDGTPSWNFRPDAPQTPPGPPAVDPAISDTNSGDVDDLPVTGDILLVEDDSSMAKLYTLLLETRGYTVRHACDGLDGFDRVMERRPDLVLLDIMMPRMNGIAFLQALRATEMRDVPVVVLSNLMEKQLVDEAMALGALEYMIKAQTRPEALVGALPHWLRGERAFTY
jgi:CheY-like chemotaxis protein